MSKIKSFSEAYPNEETPYDIGQLAVMMIKAQDDKDAIRTYLYRLINELTDYSLRLIKVAIEKDAPEYSLFFNMLLVMS